MNPFRFLQEARDQVKKVVWPTGSETLVSTVMVVVMAALFTAFFALVDTILRFGLGQILSFFA